MASTDFDLAATTTAVAISTLEKGKTYGVGLFSSEMDSFLRIEGSKRNNLAEDDDSGDGLNSRISFSPTEDGVYR
jgi:hypothetical protein